jgi:hypothetical protein
MKKKEWREVFRPNLDKLIANLMILEVTLETGYP